MLSPSGANSLFRRLCHRKRLNDVIENRTATRRKSNTVLLLTAHRSLLTVRGFTLIELVITVAVLAILTLGVIPLVQVYVKRQKEEQLHAALREMREAIDQFHREA